MQSASPKLTLAVMVLCIGGGLAMPTPAHAQGDSTLATYPIDDCDRLAASPLDTRRPPGVEGVTLSDITPEAIPACEKSISNRPNSGRAYFQLGRAYDKANRGEDALLQYQYAAVIDFHTAVMERHLPMFNTGWIYYRGTPDVPRNLSVAFEHFRNAADDGLVLAMPIAARMLERGEGLPRPDLQGAAVYWRRMAELGDKEYEAKLNSAIQEGRIASVVPKIPPPNSDGLTTSQKVGVATVLAAGVTGALCYYFPDQCKELAWEATKGVVQQGAKEAVRSQR